MKHFKNIIFSICLSLISINAYTLPISNKPNTNNVSTPLELPAEMLKVQNHCHRITESLEYIACPQINIYKINKSQDLAILFDELFLYPEQTSLKIGHSEILELFGKQIETAYNMEEIPPVRKKVLWKIQAEYRNLILNFGASEYWIDKNSSWAPNVDSKTLIIYNPVKQEALIVEHGHTDG